MAHNDSHPSSDTKINVPSFETVIKPKGHNDIDFICKWVDITVKNEIWRGKKLCEEKPIPDKIQHEYDVVDIDFLGSFCRENQRHGRKGYSRFKITTSRAVYPSGAYSHSILKSNISRTKSKNLRKCSMRIAELAVPTKRQCIDTWRNKSYLLPEFMVERLKQNVLDQRPIVKISEAIYCFQRQKAKRSKCTTQNKNEMNYVLKPYNQMDTRTLCIIFGHKIAKLLSKPLNITLNPELQKLSNVIGSEIAQMISKSKYVSKQRKAKYLQKNTIQIDVANKITVWIAGILEDLTIKLLEEDLKVKEKATATIITEQIVTLTEKILMQEKNIINTDLEEEEGPVLDIIDDLVQNVLDICEPPPVQADEEFDTSSSSTNNDEGSENPVTDTDMILEENINTDIENNSTEEIVDKDLTDTEHFRNEILNIINNIDKDISISSDIIIAEKNKQDIITEKGVNDNSGDENVQLNDESINALNDEIGENDTVNDNADKNNLNVSEVFEILDEDSGDEKNSKKVKFSLTDLVNSNIKDIITSTAELPTIKWNSNIEHLKHNIFFAEPNEHLLSNADELWPSELAEKPSKISNSVSKSVTSLGNIYEDDDKQMTPTDNESYVTDQQETNDTNQQEKTILDKVTSTSPTEKYDFGNQTHHVLNEGFNKSTLAIIDTSAIKDDSKKETIEDVDKSESIPQASEDNALKVDTDENSKQEKHLTESTEIVNGRPEGGEPPSHENQSLIDYAWKVHLSTAPSWVTVQGYDHGEPSENSIQFSMTTKVKNIDIRKWCKDLEKAFINLELWENWIENACKKTILIKQKEITCVSLSKKSTTNWIRHRRNIHKDAILWTKLHLRTVNNFKNMKKKYNNIEYCSNKAQSSDLNKVMFQMCEFENLSVMLHEMIVSAEYCAMCTCKKSKHDKNVKYLHSIIE